MPLKNFANIGELQQYEYLQGNITGVDKKSDTCNITIGESSFDGVPIFYHCNPDAEELPNGALKNGAKAFEEDDDVVVLSELIDGTIESGKKFVIAHIGLKRKCATVFELTIIVTDCSTGELLSDVNIGISMVIEETTIEMSERTNQSGLVVFYIEIPDGVEQDNLSINIHLTAYKGGYISTDKYLTLTGDSSQSICLVKKENEEDNKDNNNDDDYFTGKVYIYLAGGGSSYVTEDIISDEIIEGDHDDYVRITTFLKTSHYYYTVRERTSPLPILSNGAYKTLNNSSPEALEWPIIYEATHTITYERTVEAYYYKGSLVHSTTYGQQNTYETTGEKGIINPSLYDYFCRLPDEPPPGYDLTYDSSILFSLGQERGLFAEYYLRDSLGNTIGREYYFVPLFTIPESYATLGQGNICATFDLRNKDVFSDVQYTSDWQRFYFT